MDRLRVRQFARRLETGEDEIAAFWAVASDPGTGYSRFRGATERPPEIVLRRKLASLLARVAPDLVDRARDLALIRLGELSDDAVRAISEVVTGDFADGHVARARLDAARVILGSIGVHEQSPAASAQANVVVSLGDGLRQLRHVEAEVRDAPTEDS